MYDLTLRLLYRSYVPRYRAVSQSTRTYHRFPLQHYSTTVHDRDLPHRADRYIPDLHDLAHVTGWESYSLHDAGQFFPGLDMYFLTDPAQQFTTAGWDVDYLDRVERFQSCLCNDSLHYA